jgi:GNAT superfamily N-acetyltransferase
MIHTDLRLAQRIERTAALNQADDAHTHAQFHLHSQATSQPIGDGVATFVRADWPINTAIGLGLANVGQSDQIEEVEAFYAPFGVAPRVVVCPFTDRDLLQQLGRRGYYVAQFMNVHPRLITSEDGRELGPHDGIGVTQVMPDQADEWALINVRSGRGEDDIPADDKWLALAQLVIRNPCVTGFIAWVDGQPAGSAALSIRDGMASFFSTSTHPRYRRRGVQAALIRARLAFAQRSGCDLAVVTTSPGSDSQRNVQRYGFGVGYTRITFTRDHVSVPDA